EIVGVHHDDVFPMAYPFAHIGGPVRLMASLAAGFCVVLFETFDFERSPKVMGDLGATLLGSAVPFFLAFLDAQQAHGSEPMFPRLRFGVAGGAPLPTDVIRRFRDELGCAGILNAWGLTEFPCATSVAPTDPLWVMEQTVGRPVSGIEVRVVGSTGEVLPAGTEGELRLRGPQRFLGYVDSSLNATATDADGFVCTGDLGLVDDGGYVRITGRLKDVIIRNAENISALEIEGVLFSHPSIATVAVIGLPDERKGERCCAVVVLSPPNAQLTLTDIGEHCRDAGLAPQKIPEQLEIVDALPMNSMGKIIKNELRARFAVSSAPPVAP
ncbi:MAG: class I adenylate-forming enzyme family protein, partial [Acidimicrobiia bacterium]